MSRKALSVFMAVCLLLVLLVGFLTISQAKEKVTVIKVSNGVAQTHPIVVALNEKFKKIVEEKTNGRYKVEIYFSNQLGDDVKATEALRAGTLETCVTSTAPLVGFTKELAIFDIPFLFNNEKEADFVLDGPIGKKTSGLLTSKGLVNLAWMENGFRHLTNSVREVKTPADLKGMKVRTMENPFHLAAWRALGANPVPMSWAEVFTALQSKTIDGQENPVPNFYTAKIPEVNKYITLTGHVYSPMLFLYSKQLFDKIPNKDQKIIIDAARETALLERQLNREATINYVEAIKKEGGVVTVLIPEQKKAFQDMTAPVWNQVKDKVGADLIKQLKAELDKERK